jgi:hypothetical protein
MLRLAEGGGGRVHMRFGLLLASSTAETRAQIQNVNSTELTPSWEANIRLASQKFPA